MALLPEVELATDEQKVSYGFGLQFGDQLLRNNFDGLDLEAVLAGISHWYEHRQAAIDRRGDQPQLPGDPAAAAGQGRGAGEQAQALAEQFMQRQRGSAKK